MTTVAATTAIRMLGNRFLRASSRIAANVARPIASVTQFVSPSRIAPTIAQRLRSGPSPSMENPNSFGSWLIRTVKAIPFM
ncbi:hypothetical protein ACVISU_001933 [Bradyrhizobium sp. USDA 4452]